MFFRSAPPDGAYVAKSDRLGRRSKLGRWTRIFEKLHRRTRLETQNDRELGHLDDRLPELTRDVMGESS